MTYVVKGECVDCKETPCVAVCPVDCFFELENMLVIDPDICIDCAICEPECPVDAIVSDRKLKPEDHRWLKFNEDMSRVGAPVITKVKPPMEGHETVNYTRDEAFEKASRIPFVDKS